MRDLGANLDVLESQLIDVLNEVFQDPKATSRFMAELRACGEQLQGRSHSKRPASARPKGRKRRVTDENEDAGSSGS
jgi:hypothetical protein